MSFDLPASIERDVERYAEAEHISPTEAAVKLIREALKAKGHGPSKGELSEIEWQELRAVPSFAFLEKLPDNVADRMATASKRTRVERLVPRA